MYSVKTLRGFILISYFEFSSYTSHYYRSPLSIVFFTTFLDYSVNVLSNVVAAFACFTET